MFKGIANIAQLVRQAQQVQARMGEMKDQLNAIRCEGSAGGGMVQITAAGDMRITAITIDDSLIQAGDREMVEELVLGAVNQALEKAREAAAAKMQSAAAEIPGLSELMSQSGIAP